MANNPMTCSEAIDAAILSAARDGLLSTDKMGRISRHVATCEACQTRLGQFEEVATMLRNQRELDPGDRIVEGVRQRAAPAPRGSQQPRGPHWQSLKLLAPVAAVLLLFVYVLHAGPGARPPAQATSTSTAASSPTALATATATVTLAPGTLQVSDPVIARQLTFAFARNNDVWVSWHGQPPQQMTHLGLGAQTLSWYFFWSDDQSRLLAMAQSQDTPPVLHSWIIAPQSGTVAELPSSAPIGVEALAATWIGDRYLVYVSRDLSHSQLYNVYDTQTQRTLSTTLADQAATELEVRGTSVYFTDYYKSAGPGPGPTPGVVRRYDLATNTITTAFTVPAALLNEGLPSGGWDLSADASRIISSSQCFSPPCQAYFQDTSGAETTILRTQQVDSFSISIAPDGMHAAGVIGGSNGVAPAVIQQALPSGSELTTALHEIWQNGPPILGWVAQPSGILVEDVQEDASHNNTVAVTIYDVPVGTDEPAHVVETVQGAVTFAPMGA